MNNRFPKWWLPYYIVRTLYLKFGVITLVVITPQLTFCVLSYEHFNKVDYIFLLGCWFLLFAPFSINYIIANRRKKKILAIITKVKETGYFNPKISSEFCLFWQNTYLGFDFKKGTFLYVRIYPGRNMDVIGFDAYTLTRTEVEDSNLHLFTEFSSLPMISINTDAASNIANKLYAMKNNSYTYTYNFNFTEILKKKRSEFESMTGLSILSLS